MSYCNKRLLLLFVFGKLGIWGNFTVKESDSHNTECYWFLPNSVYTCTCRPYICILNHLNTKLQNLWFSSVFGIQIFWNWSPHCIPYLRYPDWNRCTSSLSGPWANSRRIQLPDCNGKWKRQVLKRFKDRDGKLLTSWFARKNADDTIILSGEEGAHVRNLCFNFYYCKQSIMSRQEDIQSIKFDRSNKIVQKILPS